MGISVFPTPKKILAQTSEPTDKDTLWIDTDETASSIGLIPTGGIAGKVLSKIDEDDYNAQWSNPLSFSTEHISGKYYRTMLVSDAAPKTITPANRTIYTSILIPTNKTYDRIGIHAASNFSGSASVRLGIYSDLNGKPDTVVIDAGLIAPNAANTSYEITINQTLTPGFYWLAFNSITLATTNSYLSSTSPVNGAGVGCSGSYNSLDFRSEQLQFGFNESVNVTAGFATAGTLTTVNNAVLVGIRAS